MPVPPTDAETDGGAATTGVVTPGDGTMLNSNRDSSVSMSVEIIFIDVADFKLALLQMFLLPAGFSEIGRLRQIIARYCASRS